MTYNSIVSYYFTGTGNSYSVATWLDEAARSSTTRALLKPLSAAAPAVDLQGEGTALLALFTPTHGFTAPWTVIRFAARLPRLKGVDAIICPTRAGTKFGKVFFPGLEGTSGYLLALILTLKGARVRGVMAVDMPSNWTALHPGFPAAEAEAILTHAKPRADRFFNQVLSGRTCFKGILELFLGLLLIPVSLGFLLLGRISLAKLFYASDGCTGCALCAENCPVGAIRMRGGVRKTPWWTFDCQSCMRCMNICPHKAIDASYPLAAVYIILYTAPVTWLVLEALRLLIPLVSPSTRLLNDVFSIVQYLLGLVLLYPLAWLLFRIKLLNRLLTWLTPTHYYRRYNTPGVDLRKLN